ncbi:hypothetical protein FO519_004110 [Halicephalobus sp. NKZ332]|nr:hypothetical protein FO519_004110 [Halicephalobus sp. NKZ332]
MGNCFGKRRPRELEDRRISTWSIAPKDNYFDSSYALLIGYKDDEELCRTMEAIKDTVEGGLVDGDCFVENLVVECLVGLLDNPTSRIKLLALSTLSTIVAQGPSRDSRESPIADLLVDCGILQKLQLLLKHHSDADTVTAAVGCLKEIVIEDNKVIELLSVLDFLLTCINRATPKQLDHFGENEILDPLSVLISSSLTKPENIQLAVKVVNALLRKNSGLRRGSQELINRLRLLSETSINDLPDINIVENDVISS